MTVKGEGRLAGLIYFGVVVTGIFTLAYAPPHLIVDGDPAATRAAIAANQELFQAANYAAVAMCGFFLALPFALARFLFGYGRIGAQLMIIFVAASIPFSLLAISRHFELFSIIANGAASADAIGELLADYDRWMDIASIFWGLWLAPLGWLILKSGAIPRVLGALLVIGCIGYLANYFGPMIYAGYEALSFRSLISMPGSIGEIGTCLWLVVMGARQRAGN